MVFEVWLPILGFEGRYEVSSLGRVKSLKRFSALTSNNQFSRFSAERIVLEKLLKPCLRKGYPCVTLFKNGKRTKSSVHRLVALHFIPVVGGKTEVNHKNGVKSDNRAENLEWVTSSENTIHWHTYLKGDSND